MDEQSDDSAATVKPSPLVPSATDLFSALVVFPEEVATRPGMRWEKQPGAEAALRDFLENHADPEPGHTATEWIDEAVRHVIEALRRYGARTALAPEYNPRKMREDYKRLEKALSAAVGAIQAWRGNPVQVAHVERIFVTDGGGRADQGRRAIWDRQFKREAPCPADPEPRDPMVDPLKQFLSAVSAASASIGVKGRPSAVPTRQLIADLAQVWFQATRGRLPTTTHNTDSQEGGLAFEQFLARSIEILPPELRPKPSPDTIEKACASLREFAARFG
ncbi:MAG: hypothetical protein KF899_04300 [Parvibaculum sp.]|nr:hypothetical protein [Parvibaculum sp.]